MAGGVARPVRIARARPEVPVRGTGPEEGRGEKGSGSTRREGRSPGEGAGPIAAGRPRRWRANDLAVTRSLRLFLTGFVLAPVLLWLIFLGATLTSPYASVREDLGPPTAIGGLILPMVLVGYLLTLGRTPVAFRFARSTGRLQVRPYFGRGRSFRIGPEAYQSTLEVYRAGWLGGGDCELVEVVCPPHGRWRWVVDRGLLDRVLPRHPRAKGRQPRGRGPEEGRRSPPDDPGPGRDD